MARADRYDVLRLDGVTKTTHGGLRIPATLTRTGVFEYRRADGTTSRELRRPEEVFSPTALASLESAPLTIGHVPQVGPDNWGSVAAGHVVGTPKRDGDFVASDCMISRGDAIRGVEDKSLQELSCGYSVDIDPTPGMWQGQPYDVEQKNMTYNHVALLPQGAGRAGPDVRLRTDAKDGEITDIACHDGTAYPAPVTLPIPPVVVTPPVVAPPAAPAPDALLGRIDALTATNADLQKRLDAMPAQIEAAATARASLLTLVTPHMPKGADGTPWRADDKAEGTIIREALASLRPEVKLDGRSDDYVRGVFEEALRTADSSRANAGAMQAPLHPAMLRGDAGGDMDELEMRNKAAKKKSADAWKVPPKGAVTKDSVRK